MMNEQVRRIMTTDPVVVSPNQTVQDVSELMVRERVQQIPVVNEEHHLVGLITSYDLWRNTSQGEANEDQLVKDVMTTNVLSITPLDKVGTAAELFMDRRFKSLPVINLRNELKGVVTAFDVIKHVLKEEYPEPILYKEVILGTTRTP